LETEVAGFC